MRSLGDYMASVHTQKVAAGARYVLNLGANECAAIFEGWYKEHWRSLAWKSRLKYFFKPTAAKIYKTFMLINFRLALDAISHERWEDLESIEWGKQINNRAWGYGWYMMERPVRDDNNFKAGAEFKIKIPGMYDGKSTTLSSSGGATKRLSSLDS